MCSFLVTRIWITHLKVGLLNALMMPICIVVLRICMFFFACIQIVLFEIINLNYINTLQCGTQELCWDFGHSNWCIRWHLVMLFPHSKFSFEVSHDISLFELIEFCDGAPEFKSNVVQHHPTRAPPNIIFKGLILLNFVVFHFCRRIWDRCMFYINVNWWHILKFSLQCWRTVLDFLVSLIIVSPLSIQINFLQTICLYVQVGSHILELPLNWLLQLPIHLPLSSPVDSMEMWRWRT